METQLTLTTKDGKSIAYRRWSSPSNTGNTPILLIHGASSNMTRWSEFVSRTKLAVSHDILRLDLRGHGQSLCRSRIGLEIWCSDITDIFRRHNYEQAILIGHCLGANLSVAYAARQPRQVIGMVLIEPILNAALARKLRLLMRVVSPLRILISLIRWMNRCGFYRRRLETLDLYALDSQFRTILTEPGGAEEFERRYSSPWHDLKTIPTANFLQDLVEVVQPLPLEEIQAPFLTLLSNGRSFVDPVTTRALLNRCPNGEVRTLESKHWIPTEQPAVMREMIEAWVKSRFLRT